MHNTVPFLKKAGERDIDFGEDGGGFKKSRIFLFVRIDAWECWICIGLG